MNCETASKAPEKRKALPLITRGQEAHLRAPGLIQGRSPPKLWSISEIVAIKNDAF